MRQIRVDQNDRPVQNARKPKKKQVRKKKTAAAQAGILTKIKSFSFPLKFSFGKTSTKLKRKTTKTKRRLTPAWGKFAAVGGSLAVLAIITGFTGYVMVRDAWVNTAGLWLDQQRLSIIQNTGLVLREVSVVGRNRTDANAILAALEISQGDSLVDFDPAEARIRIEKQIGRAHV